MSISLHIGHHWRGASEFSVSRRRMPEKFQAKRIASWFESAALGVASLKRDLAAFEALRDDDPLARNSRRGPVAVTLRALDAICRAKRSGLLSAEQVERLPHMLCEISCCSETLARLGFRLRSNILEQLETSDYGKPKNG
jgi:hypothetical protein